MLKSNCYRIRYGLVWKQPFFPIACKPFAAENPPAIGRSFSTKLFSKVIPAIKYREEEDPIVAGLRFADGLCYWFAFWTTLLSTFYKFEPHSQQNLAAHFSASQCIFPTFNSFHQDRIAPKITYRQIWSPHECSDASNKTSVGLSSTKPAAMVLRN